MCTWAGCGTRSTSRTSRPWFTTFAAQVSSSVRLPDFIRTTTFRWTLVVSGAFALCILLMFGLVYWQTASYMTARVDGTITRDADAIARDVPERSHEAID